jgi:hypothetical protein
VGRMLARGIAGARSFLHEAQHASRVSHRPACASPSGNTCQRAVFPGSLGATCSLGRNAFYTENRKPS